MRTSSASPTSKHVRNTTPIREEKKEKEERVRASSSSPSSAVSSVLSPFSASAASTPGAAAAKKLKEEAELARLFDKNKKLLAELNAKEKATLKEINYITDTFITTDTFNTTDTFEITAILTKLQELHKAQLVNIKKLKTKYANLQGTTDNNADTIKNLIILRSDIVKQLDIHTEFHIYTELRDFITEFNLYTDQKKVIPDYNPVNVFIVSTPPSLSVSSASPAAAKKLKEVTAKKKADEERKAKQDAAAKKLEENEKRVQPRKSYSTKKVMEAFETNDNVVRVDKNKKSPASSASSASPSSLSEVVFNIDEKDSKTRVQNHEMLDCDIFDKKLAVVKKLLNDLEIKTNATSNEIKSITAILQENTNHQQFDVLKELKIKLVSIHEDQKRKLLQFKEIYNLIAEKNNTQFQGFANYILECKTHLLELESLEETIEQTLYNNTEVEIYAEFAKINTTYEYSYKSYEKWNCLLDFQLILDEIKQLLHNLTLKSEALSKKKKLLENFAKGKLSELYETLQRTYELICSKIIIFENEYDELRKKINDSNCKENYNDAENLKKHILHYLTSNTELVCYNETYYTNVNTLKYVDINSYKNEAANDIPRTSEKIYNAIIKDKQYTYFKVTTSVSRKGVNKQSIIVFIEKKGETLKSVSSKKILDKDTILTQLYIDTVSDNPTEMVAVYPTTVTLSGANVNEENNKYIQTVIVGGLNKSKTPKKEILGKIRCIYKVPGSRKEHVKHNGQLISVSDYKKLMKQR